MSSSWYCLGGIGTSGRSFIQSPALGVGSTVNPATVERFLRQEPLIHLHLAYSNLTNQPLPAHKGRLLGLGGGCLKDESAYRASTRAKIAPAKPARNRVMTHSTRPQLRWALVT